MAQNCRLWRGAYNAAARWLKLLQPVYFQKREDKYLGFTKNISGSNCTGERWKNRIIMPLRGDLNGSGVPLDGQEATLLPTLLAKFEKQQHLHSSSPHLPPLHDGDDNRILNIMIFIISATWAVASSRLIFKTGEAAATSEQHQTSYSNQNAIKHVLYLIPQWYGKPTLVWITWSHPVETVSLATEK